MRRTEFPLFLRLRWSLILALLIAPAWAQDENAPAPGTEGDGEAAETAAEAAPPEPEPPQYASRRDRDQTLLAERFPDDTQWLSLPEPENETLALFRPAAAEPKGALLMFYSAENPPHWPAPLANLRQALPRHGWATFAVTLPLPPKAPVPERPEDTLPKTPAPDTETPDEEEATGDEAGEPDEENAPAAEPAANEEAEEDLAPPLPDHETRIAQRVNAALNWLDANGQGNLVVLVDPISAPEVMAVLRPQLEAGAQGEPPSTGESPLSGPIRALILVNQHGAITLDRAELEALFAVPALPLLDVFLGPDARTREQQRRHRDSARRLRLEHYQTLVIGRPDAQDPEDERSFWVRRIQGFMHRQAEGREVRLNPPR
jgi:hypothetical protein